MDKTTIKLNSFKKRNHPKKEKVLSFSAMFLVLITYCIFTLYSSHHRTPKVAAIFRKFKVPYAEPSPTISTTEEPKNLFINTVNSPVVHHKASYPIGAWMKDPTSNDDDIFVMNNFLKNHRVQVYKNESNIIKSRELDLPYDWGGTGHVVLNDHIFYNKFNSNTIVKYNWKEKRVVLESPLTNAGFGNQCPYQWAGSTDIDLAADTMGLWVIYGTEESRWKVVISKMNPETLQTISSWNVNFTKRAAGNAFMAYGVFYTLRRHDAFNTYLNFAFDTKTGEAVETKIPFTSKFGYISMLDYNHKERKLYAWDKGYLVTYSVNFY